jgi:hypothetical protein
MKTLFLATALAMSVGMSAAFASVTVYTDGSTFDSATANTAPKTATMQVGSAGLAGWHGKAGGSKVVRFGPPDAGGFTG